jgi:hypothetical protein
MSITRCRTLQTTRSKSLKDFANEHKMSAKKKSANPTGRTKGVKQL